MAGMGGAAAMATAVYHREYERIVKETQLRAKLNQMAAPKLSSTPAPTSCPGCGAPIVAPTCAYCRRSHAGVKAHPVEVPNGDVFVCASEVYGVAPSRPGYECEYYEPRTKLYYYRRKD